MRSVLIHSYQEYNTDCAKRAIYFKQMNVTFCKTRSMSSYSNFTFLNLQPFSKNSKAALLRLFLKLLRRLLPRHILFMTWWAHACERQNIGLFYECNFYPPLPRSPKSQKREREIEMIFTLSSHGNSDC